MSEEDGGTPTRKDSGTVAVFEQTAEDALRELERLGLDERGEELLHEARELTTVFRAWRVMKPEGEDRAAAISRVLALHRNVAEYVTLRRG